MSDQETQEPSPVEQEAIALGWQPKEQFESDPKNEGKKWRSADDFMDRKPLFDKIDQQGRELKEVKKALQSLAEQNKKVESLAYERAIQELKAQKVQALENADHQAVVEIDEKLADLKKPQPQQQTIDPDFSDWVEKNQWYSSDKRMRTVADGIGYSLVQDGLSKKEVLAGIEERMKELYPEKFGFKRVPPSPDAGGTKSSGGGKNVESMLTSEERRIMEVIVKSGVDRDKYLKDFVAIQPERFKGVKL